MQKKIRTFIEKHHMIRQGEHIVAGISGGADSVFLFYLLLELKREKNLTITAVHVHHMIRGDEADADEAFVRLLCKDNGVEYRSYRFPVAEIAKRQRISVEEAGRNLRYQAFEQTRKEVGASRIALAHHQNDCAETMLYNLARGSGIGGLCSLRPVRNFLIRPLLCISREEIEVSLKERGIVWRTDSTNQELAYTRNRIRHQVIPVLSDAVNQRAVQHMASAAGELMEIEDFLQSHTRSLIRQRTQSDSDGVLIRSELLEEEALFQRYVIKASLEKAAGTRRDIGRVHIEAVQELLKKETGKKLHLPYRLTAERTYGGVRIRRENMEQKSVKMYPVVVIRPQGDTVLGEAFLHCEMEENSGEIIPEKRYTKWIDYDKIKDILVVRNRLPGDFIVINEAGGRKKIKDYFIDQKIPREERDQVLLVADGSEIVWIVGFRISQNYKVGTDTRRILRMEIKGGKIHGR